MSGAEALLLGLLQGLTEFLPVSSSGHLVLAEHLLGVESDGITFEVVVHAATLVAVVLFYRRRIGLLVEGVLRGRPDELRYAGKLLLATLPAVVVVLGAEDLLRRQFEAPGMAAAGLLVTGAVVWTTRWSLPRARTPEPGWGAALLIGVAQSVAILPGISRSGTTVAVALALGVAPLAAAEFSFLMSVLAITGAVVRTLPELAAPSAAWSGALLPGVAGALVSGMAALYLFVRLLHTRHFHRFAYYAWAVGGVVSLWLLAA